MSSSLSATKLDLSDSTKSIYQVNKEMARLLKYLLKNASHDDARPLIQGIHITKKLFEVTNGFVIARVVFEKEQEFFPEGTFTFEFMGSDKVLVETISDGFREYPNTMAIFDHNKLNEKGMIVDTNIVAKSRVNAKIAFDPKIMSNLISYPEIKVVRLYVSFLILMQIVPAGDLGDEFTIYACQMPMTVDSGNSRNNGASINITENPPVETEEKKEGTV